MILQTASDYASNVALATGLLVVLVVLAYILASRRVGRERDEWDHERTIKRQLRHLSRTPQVSWTGYGETFAHDVDYLLGGRESVRRFGWLRHWVACFAARHSRYETDVVDSARPPIFARQRQWLRRRLPVGVVGHAMPVDDADGRTIYVASVNGRRLAHRERDALLEDVRMVAAAEADNDRAPGTLSEHYAADIVDGFVDLRESRQRLRGDCRTRIQSNLRRERSLDLQQLRERLVYDSGFRYPPDVVEEMLDTLDRDEMRRRQDGTVTYQRFGNA